MIITRNWLLPPLPPATTTDRKGIVSVQHAGRRELANTCIGLINSDRIYDKLHADFTPVQMQRIQAQALRTHHNIQVVAILNKIAGVIRRTPRYAVGWP